MNILQLPNDIFLHITSNLYPSALCNIFKTSKQLSNKINGKMLLYLIPKYNINNNYCNFINDHIVIKILNDVDVNNIKIVDYKVTPYDKILLLKYILNNDIDKTIVMLKLIGNTDIFYDNVSMCKIFPNEQKKLYYCFKANDFNYFVQNCCPMNLHLVYLMFFTPVEFIKRILPLIPITCEFKVSKSSYSSTIVYNNKYEDDYFYKLFGDAIYLTYSLRYVTDCNERIPTILDIFSNNNNFKKKGSIMIPWIKGMKIDAFDGQIAFDSVMDSDYVIPYNYKTNYGSGLMGLVAYGAQDIYLTGDPRITFFNVVYKNQAKNVDDVALAA